MPTPVSRVYPEDGPSLPSILLWIFVGTLAACAPKTVSSPLERAPPPEIAQARALILAGDIDQGRSLYASFIRTHPETTEADLARLELGVAEANEGRCTEGLSLFEQAERSADQAIALQATLHRGRCLVALGDPDAALEAFRQIASQRFSDKQQTLLWESAVNASQQAEDATVALVVLDRLLSSRGAAPNPEEALLVVEEIAGDRLSDDQAAEVFDQLEPGGRAQQALAKSILPSALEAQNAELVTKAADALRAEADGDSAVRALVVRADEFLHGNPYVVGVLLPLSGRGQEVGRQLLRGMQLAAIVEGGPQLIVEDTAGDPARTAQAVESLIDDQRVVAILGPVGTRATMAAIERARRAGVPLLTFSTSERASETGDRVFRFLYSPRDEVRALVRAAQRKGWSGYVILYPDHGYGRALKRLFDEEVTAAGERVCPAVAYPPGTTSFVEHVQMVLQEGCDVVLLADAAGQVALIAPTFAAEGAWSTIDGILPAGAEQEVHFLVPTPSWSQSLLERAERYLQGAFVAQPYFEASDEGVNADFRQAYLQRYAEDPQMFAAYGYDAYRMIAAALRQGYQRRSDLAEALSRGVGVSSVTSIDSFSDDRIPAQPPRVYQVQGAALEPLR